MKIEKKLLQRIKTLLERESPDLDMFTADVRLAYVVYYAYQQDLIEIIDLRNVIKGAHERFSDIDVSYVAFERSVYRALEKLCGTWQDGQDSRVKTFVKLLEKLGE